MVRVRVSHRAEVETLHQATGQRRKVCLKPQGRSDVERLPQATGQRSKDCPKPHGRCRKTVSSHRADIETLSQATWQRYKHCLTPQGRGRNTASVPHTRGIRLLVHCRVEYYEYIIHKAYLKQLIPK